MTRNVSRIPVVLAVLTAGFVTATSAIRSALAPLAPAGVPVIAAAPVRAADGPYGGPALAANVGRTFVIGGQCGIPSGASAVAFNFTITQPTGPGDLRVFPAGAGLPLVSTQNWRGGQTRASNAIIGLGDASGITLYAEQATGTTDVVIDIYGYFAK